MKVTLIHNPTAGDGTRTGDDIVAMLEELGYDVTYQSIKTAWKKALKKRADLVVAAGGDGTVRKVALELAGGQLPMAVLPVGTANNIGKTLRMVGDAREHAARWAPPQPRPFDLGWVRAGTREADDAEHFIEAWGGGIFADAMALGQDVEGGGSLLGRETDRALTFVADVTREARARHWDVRIDGRDHSGEFIAVEVLNIRFSGANVPIAPNADPGDGELDVVLIDDAHRDALLGYLMERLEHATGDPPGLPVHRGRVIELNPDDEVTLRLDDELWKRPRKDRRAPLSIGVDAGVVPMLYGGDPD